MAECLDQRQARDLPWLASEGFSVALAMEIEASRQAMIARRGTFRRTFLLQDRHAQGV